MGEYLQLPYVSSSLLNAVLTRSPHHALYEQEHREQDAAEASDFGVAIHSALLEGLDVIVPVDADSWRTNAAKDARALARSQGKIPLLVGKVPLILSAVRAASEFIVGSELAGVFDSGKPEQTVIWDEARFREKWGGNPATPLLCKARPDWLTDEWIIHVKTTQGSAQPESWIRNQLVPLGYDVAACFYERPPEMEGRQSIFLVIEQQEPHGCSLVALSPAMHEIASGKVDRALATWARCVQTGKWPGYDSRIHYAEPAAWQLAREEEQRLGAEYDARAAEQA